MNSPEMYRLLEDIPKGAEAMIIRVMHIVTEKGELLIYIYKYNLFITCEVANRNNSVIEFSYIVIKIEKIVLHRIKRRGVLVAEFIIDKYLKFTLKTFV